MQSATAAATAFLAAHAAPLPAAANLESVAAALDALPKGFSPAALASNESYFTFATEDGRPLVTLSRPRAFDRSGLYTLALTDGRAIAAFDRNPSVRRVYEAVYSYIRSTLPADCDAAEELESYLVSFADNWAASSESSFPTFRASAFTRAARWARRIALARAADLAEEAAILAAPMPSADLPPVALAEEAGAAVARAAIRAARALQDAPAGLGLAPVTPALESPLVPFSPGAGRVALAIARGINPARLIGGDFGPRGRVIIGGR